MRSSILTTTVVAVLAGGVAGVVSSRLVVGLSGAVDRVPAVQPEPAPPASAARASAEAVEDLRSALADLRERLERLETSVPRARTPIARGDDRSDVAGLRAELDELRTSGLVPSREQLEQALDERLEQRNERTAALAVLRGDAGGTLDERAASLGAWLELEGAALERVRALLERRSEQRNEVLRLWTQGVAAAQLEDRARADDRELRRGLEALVSGASFERLQELYRRIADDER